MTSLSQRLDVAGVLVRFTHRSSNHRCTEAHRCFRFAVSRSLCIAVVFLSMTVARAADVVASRSATTTPNNSLAAHKKRIPGGEDYFQKLADAIYVAEGGKRARVPYGILSVKVSGEQEARRVCLNTIRNAFGRWSRAGQPGDFIAFLAATYCPESADPKGHQYWKRNVTQIFNRRCK